MLRLLNIIRDVRPEFEINEDTELIGSGYLDSYDLVLLVSEMDSLFHISINGVDIIPENFANPRKIADLLINYGVDIEL